MNNPHRLRSLLSPRATGRAASLCLSLVSLLCFAVETRARAVVPPRQQSPQPAQGAATRGKEHCPPPTAAENKKVGAATRKLSIPDVEVVDQDGNKSRFYTDLVKDKMVVINFVFTSCTYICPVQGATFAKLQQALGDRLGRDVHLISVSTDPLVDTPQRLKAWGARFGAKPGWTLVTGRKEEMDRLLRALTADPTRRGEHSAVVLVGDFERGAWLSTYGLAEPERYVRFIADLSKSAAAQSPAEKR